jgi:3-deoxy-alpha-D-manno-octulosonate 8-oxidase
VVTEELSDTEMNEMIRVALSLDPLWQNALGPDWREIMTPQRARELYLQM